jgi:hypothetical protein
MAGHYFIP